MSQLGFRTVRKGVFRSESVDENYYTNAFDIDSQTQLRQGRRWIGVQRRWTQKRLETGLSRRSLSSKFGINETAKATVWPWFGAFSHEGSFGRVAGCSEAATSAPAFSLSREKEHLKRHVA